MAGNISGGSESRGRRSRAPVAVQMEAGKGARAIPQRSSNRLPSFISDLQPLVKQTSTAELLASLKLRFSAARFGGRDAARALVPSTLMRLPDVVLFTVLLHSPSFLLPLLSLSLPLPPSLFHLFCPPSILVVSWLPPRASMRRDESLREGLSSQGKEQEELPADSFRQ